MKEKGISLLIILLGGLILGILVLVVYQSVQRGTPANPADFFKKPEEARKIMETIVPTQSFILVKMAIYA